MWNHSAGVKYIQHSGKWSTCNKPSFFFFTSDNDGMRKAHGSGWQEEAAGGCLVVRQSKQQKNSTTLIDAGMSQANDTRGADDWADTWWYLSTTSISCSASAASTFSVLFSIYNKQSFNHSTTDIHQHICTARTCVNLALHLTVHIDHIQKNHSSYIVW